MPKNKIKITKLLHPLKSNISILKLLSLVQLNSITTHAVFSASEGVPVASSHIAVIVAKSNKAQIIKK